MPCFLDHLVIAAATLEAGAAFVGEILGTVPQPGGKHAGMASHNLLLRLSETSYLEVIAPDPTALAPNRPRWFALDELTATSPPGLATWVARTPEILAAAANSTETLGLAESMSRGTLNWLITIPPDGSLPLGGTAPALIEWPDPQHPATALPDQGLSLVRLELYHPQPERLARLLHSLDFQGPVSVCPARDGALPHLTAVIDTPRGLQVLSTADFQKLRRP